MKRLVIFLAACSSSATQPPAPDAVDGCRVELSGNFAETSTSAANCPTTMPGAGATQGDTLLAISIPSATLGARFAISLDLGAAPSPGTYTSATTALWSAAGTQTIAPAGACVFLAGNNTTPSGSFALDLASLDHGSLAVEMAVLPRVQDDGSETDCGAGTTETLALQF